MSVTRVATKFVVAEKLNLSAVVPLVLEADTVIESGGTIGSLLKLIVNGTQADTPPAFLARTRN
jgi:hypothetical protein